MERTIKSGEIVTVAWKILDSTISDPTIMINNVANVMNGLLSFFQKAKKVICLFTEKIIFKI